MTRKRARVDVTVQRSIQTVVSAARRTITREGLFVPGERVLVAVSGGPDSIGLLATLCLLKRRLGIELVAGHVNHRLREDSDADEACARAAAEGLGVPFVRTELARHAPVRANLEERAREERYAALHRLAAETSCSKIAVGHTRDDRVETFLLRLIRGSGPSGLAGIEVFRDDGVVRPLIDCSREEVERAVRDIGLEFRHDPMNRDPRFQRTRVRMEILPLMKGLNPAVSEAIARSAAMLEAEKHIVAAWSEQQVDHLADEGGLSVSRLLQIPSGLRGYVVRAWLIRAGALARSLRARHIDAIEKLAAGSRASGEVALPRARVRRRYDRLLLHVPGRTAGVPPGPVALDESGREIAFGDWIFCMKRQEAGEWQLPGDLWSAVCSPPRVRLQVRLPRRGDRLRPLGLGGHRRLSDVFTDRKVPSSERWAYPVVSAGEEIVWVPGVVRTEALRADQSREALVIHATRRAEP